MEQINAIEIVVNAFLQNLGIWLKLPMQAITALGYEEFFVLLLPTLYWCFDQMVGLRLGMVLLLGNMTNAFFKFLFHNARPYWISATVENYTHERSFGLPSGHAQIAASVWGWLAVEVKRKWFTATAILIIFLIGLSRLYLGVHFLSDVLLGWVLGGLLVWAFSAWHKPVGDWLRQRSLTIKLFLVLLSTAIMIGLVLGVRWANISWEMPQEWAALAGDADPYNLEGLFTLGGTWMGMLSGFVLLSFSRGHFFGRPRRMAADCKVSRRYGWGYDFLFGVGASFPGSSEFYQLCTQVRPLYTDWFMDIMDWASAV